MADSHTYTDEFRRECADLVIASGKPASQMADELGVNRKTLQLLNRRLRARSNVTLFKLSTCGGAALTLPRS